MKKYADSSLYYFKQCWNRLIICVESELSNEMEQCFYKLDLYVDKGGRLKKGNSSTVSSVTINNKKFVIKRYNIKDSLHAIKRAFRPSRASVSWRNAHMLDKYHISTASPIALIENRYGILRSKSYLITELMKGECCADYFKSSLHSNEDKKKAAHSVIGILKELKAHKITHGDLKQSNILVYNSIASLIDLDSMKQHNNDRSFAKAHKKDVKRFFLNWENDSQNKKLFQGIYNDEM